MQKFVTLIIITYLFVSIGYPANAYERINEIFIERHKVFERTDKDWFFAAPLLNFFHVTTREYVIKDELLFQRGDYLDEGIVSETERNLRAMGLFTTVEVQVDSVGVDRYDLFVITKDRWTTYPAILFGTGGGQTNYGGGFQEHNLFGTGTHLALELLYRTENDIGRQGLIELRQNRFIRTPFALDAFLLANRFRTDQYIALYKPFRTIATRNSFGGSFLNSFGSEFLYNSGDATYELMPYNEQKYQIWGGRSWRLYDRVFASTLLEYQTVERGDPKYKQAYDNSGKFLMQFSSVSQSFYTITNVNSSHLEDMVVGGYGAATIGKIFPVAKGGENVYYVGGRGEQSYYEGKLYLYGQITGASAFKYSEGTFTYQEFNGLGFYRLDNKNLIAMRISQQAVWNWNALRQLVLDNEKGLRGYPVNKLAGDNRLIMNLEYRNFPGWHFSVFDFSAVAFWDMGSVWNQTEEIFDSRFYHSAGLGLRFHFTKSSDPKHTYRIDFAYNFDERKFGGIIFSTKQLFSVFRNHTYLLPSLYGTEIDVR